MPLNRGWGLGPTNGTSNVGLKVGYRSLCAKLYKAITVKAPFPPQSWPKPRFAKHIPVSAAAFCCMTLSKSPNL